MKTTKLEMIWMARYPGWKEMHTTMDLYLLGLIVLKLHNIEYIIYAIMANPDYPWYNSIIVCIY